jgi:hypothetical protein
MCIRAGGDNFINEINLINSLVGSKAVAFGKIGNQALTVAAVQLFKVGDYLIGKNLSAGTGYDSKIRRI